MTPTKSLVADKIGGEQIWRVQTEIHLIAPIPMGQNPTLDIIMDGEIVGTIPHKDAQRKYGYWLYPWGSLNVDGDNTDTVKQLRKMSAEGKFDIPRQEINDGGYEE